MLLQLLPCLAVAYGSLPNTTSFCDVDAIRTHVGASLSSFVIADVWARHGIVGVLLAAPDSGGIASITLYASGSSLHTSSMTARLSPAERTASDGLVSIWSANPALLAALAVCGNGALPEPDEPLRQAAEETLKTQKAAMRLTDEERSHVQESGVRAWIESAITSVVSGPESRTSQAANADSHDHSADVPRDDSEGGRKRGTARAHPRNDSDQDSVERRRKVFGEHGRGDPLGRRIAGSGAPGPRMVLVIVAALVSLAVICNFRRVMGACRLRTGLRAD